MQYRLPVIVLASLSLASTAFSSAKPTAVPANLKVGSTLVYIGTYTGKKSQGIYLSKLDPETGELSKPELAAEMINPSWVAIHPTGKFLYAVGEWGPYPEGSAIRGFSIGEDGKLTAINTQPPGKAPCHLAIDYSGKNILVSNFNSGSVSAFRFADNGELAPAAWTDQHPVLSNGLRPHAHCTEFDPSGRFALTCDAGLDRIYVYRYNSARGELTANDPPFAETAAGSHPRHLAFSPDGKFCYCINEAGKTVTAFSFDASHGVLLEIQTISTLPVEFKGKAAPTAEIVMHPSGKFLYGSNRGPSNIVTYSVDAVTGKLTLVGHTPTKGGVPRSFGIDPTGRWLIAANQASDNVVEFKIDLATGGLTPTGTKLEVGGPVCVQFLERKPTGASEGSRLMQEMLRPYLDQTYTASAGMDKDRASIKQIARDIVEAMPAKLSALPKRKRHILVLTHKTAGQLHVPGAGGLHALLREAQRRYEAFEFTERYTVESIDAKTLAQFDAVVVNNVGTLSEFVCENDEVFYNSLLPEYVKNGGGVFAVHAAALIFRKRPEAEYNRMLGGFTIPQNVHPKYFTQPFAIQLLDPENPLAKAFRGAPETFTLNSCMTPAKLRIETLITIHPPQELADEIYVFSPQSNHDGNTHVIVAVDKDKQSRDAFPEGSSEFSYSLIWNKEYGKGRVYYCQLGHNQAVYSIPCVARALLDGLQYAAGDLRVP